MCPDASLWSFSGYLELHFEKVQGLHAKYGDNSSAESCRCMVLQVNSVSQKRCEKKRLRTKADVGKNDGGMEEEPDDIIT